MTATITPDAIVARIAAEHPACLPTLEKFRLDYCCHGNRPLAQACADAGIPVEQAVAALQQALDAPPGRDLDRDWSAASMTELADHIEQTHHVYAREAFIRLANIVPKVVAAHGNRQPALRTLAAEVSALADDMHEHMVREERVLFPWLRRLDVPTQIHTGPPWSIRRPIDCMEHDHREVAEAFIRIRRLTNNHAIPPGACITYRSMLTLLEDLERDTRLHIHKENNILFPAGMQAEKRRLSPHLLPGTATT